MPNSLISVMVVLEEKEQVTNCWASDFFSHSSSPWPGMLSSAVLGRGLESAAEIIFIKL
jgi:hypothetical protein